MKLGAALFALLVIAAVALYGAALWSGWEPPTAGHDIDRTSEPPALVSAGN